MLVALLALAALPIAYVVIGLIIMGFAELFPLPWFVYAFFAWVYLLVALAHRAQVRAFFRVANLVPIFFSSFGDVRFEE